MITTDKAAQNALITVAIIPAYNEAGTIASVINETKKHVTSIIVVDDGSKDDTSSIVKSLGVRLIRHTHNLGKGAALKHGFLESIRMGADIIVTIDADGQHDPSDIPKLLEPVLDNQADIVIGSRYLDVHSTIPTYRKAGLSLIRFLNRALLSTHVKDTQSGFRAYSRAALETISDFDSKGYGVESEQLAIASSHGFGIIEIPVKIRYDGLENTSKKNPVLHGAEITTTLIKLAVERRPLIFFGIPGLLLIGASVITALNMLLLFNETRYFSIPLAVITLGLSVIGSLMILVSFILYALKRIRVRIARSRQAGSML